MSRGNGEYLTWVASADDRPSSRAAFVLKLPLRVVRVGRLNQRMVPAPWIFVAAAGLGLGAGLAVYFAFDWVWWPFPVVAVVLAALGFAATAFRPVGRRRRTLSELGRELDWTFRPSRARERHHDRSAREFTSAGLPLYGLPPEWAGLRYLGSSAASDDRTTSLGLAHQPDGVDGPRLDVESHAGEVTRGGLEYEVWMQTAEWHDEEPDRLDRPWTPLTVRLDGEPVTFELTREGGQWWAFRQLDGHGIVLHGEDYPPEGIELVRVVELGPYRAGLTQLDELL